jgi:hypothetical protein
MAIPPKSRRLRPHDHVPHLPHHDFGLKWFREKAAARGRVDGFKPSDHPGVRASFLQRSSRGLRPASSCVAWIFELASRIPRHDLLDAIAISSEIESIAAAHKIRAKGSEPVGELANQLKAHRSGPAAGHSQF